MKAACLVGALVAATVFGMFPSISTAGASPVPDWEGPQLVESSSENAAFPRMAVDSAGNAFVAWHQHDGSQWNVWANRYVVGSGWSTPELLENSPGDAVYPMVAVDGAGNATVVWYQNDGTQNNIWSNRYVIGTGWSTAVLVETNPGNVDGHCVDVDLAGNAIVVWHQFDGTRNNVWWSRYVVGVGWSVPELIEHQDLGDATWPSVVMDSAGGAMAEWLQYDGASRNIWASRYVVSTGWTTPQLLETGAGDVFNHMVCVDSARNAIAVWAQNDAAGITVDIWSNRYVVGVGWSTAVLIETALGGAQWPQVGFDGAGNAIATWQQYDGSCQSIWSSRYVVGTGWSTPELVETHNSGNAVYPCLAVSESGNATVAWYQYDGTRLNISSNQYIVGTGWSVPQLLEADDRGDAYWPNVATNGAGDVFVAWYQDDGTTNNILSNRLINPKAPTPPLSLQGIAGAGYVNVTWEAPSYDGDDSILGYRIYRSTTSGAETFLEQIGDVCYYNDTGLTQTVPYYYKVSAFNSIGESQLSEEVSATPTAPPGPALSAVIDADPLSGSAPLEVSFTCTVTGGAGTYTYLWDFDDGDTSTLQNPEHTFESQGTYNVSVTVTDSGGNTTEQTLEVVVEANVAPSGSTDWLPLVVGGMVVAIVAAAVALTLKRRKGKTTPAEPASKPPESHPPVG